MRAPWHHAERPVRRLLRWSAASVSSTRQDEIAAAAWLACADAGRRRGSLAFAHTALAEITDLLAVPLRLRAGRGPRIRPAPSGRGWRGPSMRVVNDLGRAARRLRSGKGTLALSIGMLALAIGVTTAMFTVLDALMLHPVPFPDAGRLTAVVLGKGDMWMSTAPAAAFRAWRDSGAFDSVEGAAQSPVVFEAGVGLVSNAGARVSIGLLDMLGVRPILGRGFTADEGRGGTEDRILISEDVWTSLFNRDPTIIGRRIAVGGVPHEVVGVMPARFRFPFSNTQAWRPLDFTAPPKALERVRPMVYARFKAGVPQADALRIADAALRSVPGIEADEHAMSRPIAQGMVDAYSRRAITALSIGVTLVFLVLCANAMNLMLTRFASRQREFAVCSALGAGRSRLLGEALTETALIGLAAAVAGLALAAALVRIATEYLPAALLTRTLTPVTLSPRAIIATSILAAVAAAIAGILPAWMGTGIDAADSLRGTTRTGTEGRPQRRLSAGLLVAEVALAAALLAGAAQLVRTFVNLTGADRGLDAEGVMTGWISLPEFAFKDRASRIAFAAALEDRLRQVPGIRQVSLSGGIPPNSGSLYFSPLRSDVPGAAEVRAKVHAYSVSPQFFELFGIRLVAGRTFSTPSSPGDVILGEQLARKLWPDGSGVGRTFTIEGHDTPYSVVGIAREVRSPSLDPLLDEPEMYHPLVVDRGGKGEATAFGSGQIFVALRCGAGCPGVDAIGRTIRELSAQTLIVRLGPMEEEYLKELARPRAAAALAAIFAVVALAASAGGLFGVLSAAVARRRREFGIRVALGIAPGRLTRLVLRQAFVLSGTGLAVGMVGAWLLARALASLTYGVSPADPLSWGIVFGSLALSALLAAWRPSVHAARVSPSELLRTE